MAKVRQLRANEIELKKSITILMSMTQRNIKNQYRKSYLGVLWTVLNPLLNMIVLAFVFGSIFGRSTTNGMDYPLYVLSGSTVFNLMRMATSNSMTCLVDNYDLMTKTRVPYYVFPVSKLLTATVNFFFSLIAMVFVMLIRMSKGVTFHWSMLMIFLPYLPSLMLFSLGISFVLATLYIRFRDLKHLYGVFLTLWTYTTPLFYTITNMSDKVKTVISYNPMYHYVTYFRDVLCGVIPSAGTLLLLYAMGLVSFAIGAVVFHYNRKRFILYI